MQRTKLRYLAISTGYFITGILIIVALVIILQNMLGFIQVHTTPAGWQITGRRMRYPHL